MKKFLFIAGLALIMFSGCTVSEPDMANGEPAKFRLVSVKSMGMTLISVNYDNQGRMTKINYGNEIVYEFSYEGTSTTPSEVVSLAYETYDVNDKEVRKLDTKTIWNNIHVNSDGYITGCSVKEWGWYYEDHYNYDTEKYELVLVSEDFDEYHGTIVYDNHGHIIDATALGDGMTYEWSGDLLMSASDDDITVRFTYSDVDNVNLQWDPNNEILGPIAISGFFGKAPAKFVKSAQFSGDMDEKIQYSYSLLDNGLINMCRVLSSDNDGFEPVLNYVYERVR